MAAVISQRPQVLPVEPKIHSTVDIKEMAAKKPRFHLSVIRRSHSDDESSVSTTEAATSRSASQVGIPTPYPTASTTPVFDRKRSAARAPSSAAYLGGLMNGLASRHAAPQTHGLADIDAQATRVRRTSGSKQSSQASWTKRVSQSLNEAAKYSSAALTPRGAGVQQRY